MSTLRRGRSAWPDRDPGPCRSAACRDCMDKDGDGKSRSRPTTFRPAGYVPAGCPSGCPFAAHGQHQVLEVLPGLRVHRPERLVHQQQHGRRPAHGRWPPAAAPPGQLPRVPVPHAGQPDRLQRPRRHLPPARTRLTAGRPAALLPQRKTDVVLDTQPRQEGPAVILEHHRQPVGDPVHRDIVQDHSAGRRVAARLRAQQGGRAAPGRPVPVRQVLDLQHAAPALWFPGGQFPGGQFPG